MFNIVEKIKNKFVKKNDEIPEYMQYHLLRSPGKKVRGGYDFTNEEHNLVCIETLNKLKEFNIKNKVKAGKKIDVAFLIDNIAKFTADSVYKEMEKSEIFNPFILFYDALDKTFIRQPKNFESHKKDVELLKSRGYNVVDGYFSDGRFIPIDNFKIDIIFLNAPAMCYSNMFLSNVYLNTKYLVCYLNYSINTINSYDYHYNNKRIASAWKHFVETREDYLEILDNSKFFGTNTVLVGYPKLDTYAKPIEECVIPDKINNGKPIVIYAPHRSIKEKWEPLNISTFHLYHKYFIDLLERYPEINFVYKPHPFIKTAIINKKVMTEDEYSEYIEKWNSAPNGLYVYDNEYINLFRHSDLLITDCGSFIGEWLPTDKPCMYLVNPERNQNTYMLGFSTIGKKILKHYYLCNNLEEIENNFKMIMLEKTDPFKNERIKLKDEIFINIGTAGKKIVEYLTEYISE